MLAAHNVSFKSITILFDEGDIYCWVEDSFLPTDIDYLAKRLPPLAYVLRYSDTQHMCISDLIGKNGNVP